MCSYKTWLPSILRNIEIHSKVGEDNISYSFLVLTLHLFFELCIGFEGAEKCWQTHCGDLPKRS